MLLKYREGLYMGLCKEVTMKHTTLKRIMTVNKSLVIRISDSATDIDYDEDGNVSSIGNPFTVLELSGGVYIELTNCTIIPRLNSYEICEHLPCDENGNLI